MTQRTNIPKAIVDTIAALRAERGPLASRLDAIDLAIENLSRVYGINGTPQPLPLERPRLVKTRAPKGEKPRADEAVTARRDGLLALIAKAEHGLTISELRKQTPKMDGYDRSNDLQALKAAGKIKRAGNTWKAA